MLVCSNCNKEISSDSKFCPNCGTHVKDNNYEQKRNIVFEGTIYKCPNCGEILNSFVSNCPVCGYELRNVNNSNAVEQLTKKLEEIESKRDPNTELKLMRMRGWYGSANAISPIDEQKISLIQNFSIPNTKEDLYEFLILSKSNIDYSVYDALSLVTENRRLLSKAWESKFEQAYLKAKILFKDDDRIVEINKMYEDRKKRINRKIFGFWIGVILIIGIPIFIFMFTLFIPKIGR